MRGIMGFDVSDAIMYGVEVAILIDQLKRPMPSSFKGDWTEEDLLKLLPCFKDKSDKEKVLQKAVKQGVLKKYVLFGDVCEYRLTDLCK